MQESKRSIFIKPWPTDQKGNAFEIEGIGTHYCFYKSLNEKQYCSFSLLINNASISRASYTHH